MRTSASRLTRCLLGLAFLAMLGDAARAQAPGEEHAAALKPTAGPGMARVKPLESLPGQSAIVPAAATSAEPSGMLGILRLDNLRPTPAPDASGVEQAGCSSCGSGGGTLGPPPVGPPLGWDLGCPTCGCGANPPCLGQKPCYPCEKTTHLGRFCCCLYHCICCQDPCYEPRWLPLADAAFFVDGVRPITQQRLRYDHGTNVRLLDRATYFWARADGQGRGPPPPLPFAFVEPSLRKYDDLTLYTEIAASRIGFFVEMLYRNIDPALQPTGIPLGQVAGFGDINLGTKSLLFDCELLQLAFQFKTYLPSGNFFKGLGNGHVSLEPSLLMAIKLGPETYFESQIAEWIPLGADPGYGGGILHYHFSVNHTLYRVLPNVPLIGTLELSGWSFQSGAYTDPVLGSNQPANPGSYVSMGPGLRLVVCDKIDFGLGTHFSLTQEHWAESLIRAEFRWRF